MSDLVPFAMLIGSGAMIATQATLNVGLGRSLDLWFFAFVFTVVQLFFCLPPLLLLGWPPRWSALSATPWWQYLGGALGVPALAAMSYGLGRTGTGTGLVGLLIGQLFMGMCIDRFGLFGAPAQAITGPKLVGFGLVILGVWISKV